MIEPAEARAVAATLLARLRQHEPGFLAAGEVDLGPALEQQLYFALRDGIPRRGSLSVLRRRLVAEALRLGAAAAALAPRPRPAAPPGGLLLVVRQPVHVRIFRPVQQALIAAGGPPVTIARVGSAAADAALASAGPRLASFLDVAGVGAITSAATGADRLAIAWSGAVDPAVTPRLDALAAHAVTTRARLAVGAGSLASAIRRTSPSLVATYDEVGSWGRLLVAAARAAGVPSLDLPHAEAADPVGTRGAGYDSLAVFGPVARARLLAAGIEPARIVEIGPPNFDALVRAAAAERSLAGPRQILFTSQYTAGTMTPEVKERTIRAALEAAAVAAPCVVVIRPHPTEGDDGIARAVAATVAADVRVVEDRGTSLTDLLLRSWLMITGSSQTVLEAAIAGVPSISINATAGPDPVTYASEGIALGAESGAEAAEHVRRLLEPEAARAQADRARSALEPHLGPLDGRASERAAELIIGLARGERAAG